MPVQRRLLFVDDEENIRTTLSLILKQHDFDVRLASTVPEALLEINSLKFDVLISDLNIGAPEDGFDVINAMGKAQPSCIRLIMTGYPAFGTALRAVGEVDAYVVKPADIDALIKTINEKLSRRRGDRMS